MKLVILTMLPMGRPSISNASDPAAMSVITSLNDNDPRTTITILDVL